MRRLIAILALAPLLVFLMACSGIRYIESDSQGPTVRIINTSPHCEDRGPDYGANRYKCWHIHQRQTDYDHDGVWYNTPTQGMENGIEWHIYAYIGDGDWRIFQYQELSMQYY